MRHERSTATILHEQHPHSSLILSRLLLYYDGAGGDYAKLRCGGCLTPFFMGRQKRDDRSSCRREGGGGVLALFNASSSSSSELLSLCLAPSAVDFGCVLLCVNEHMLENMPQVFVFLWK